MFAGRFIKAAGQGQTVGAALEALHVEPSERAFGRSAGRLVVLAADEGASIPELVGHPPAYPEDAGARDGGTKRKRTPWQNPLSAGKVLAKRGDSMSDFVMAEVGLVERLGVTRAVLKAWRDANIVRGWDWDAV